MFENREDAAAAVYQSFLNSGFSPAQSRALTAEINRENSLREEYLFGTHLDPANQATNIGMLSWQGSRAPQLQEYLASEGLLDERGNIVPSAEALQAQTDFIRQEMETNPSYRKTREQFLANPNISPEEAAVVLGDNYIRWRRTDPEYAASGQARIDEGYELLGGASQATPDARRVQYGLGDRDPGSTAQVLEAVRLGDMTKNEAARFVSEDLLEGTTGRSSYDILNSDGGPEAEDEASFLDTLGEAAANIDFANVGQAPDMPSRLTRGSGIRKGDPNAGSRALQRFGLESLVRPLA